MKRLRGAQPGNKNGARPTIWTDAIRMAVMRLAKDGKTKKLSIIADRVVASAMEGDMAAVAEIANRLDGKPVQPIEGNTDVQLTINIKRWSDGKIIEGEVPRPLLPGPFSEGGG